MDGGVQSGAWGLSTGYGSDDGHHGVHNPDIRETVGVAVNIRCVEEMAHACPRPAKFIRESYFHWPQITRTDGEILRELNGCVMATACQMSSSSVNELFPLHPSIRYI